MAIDTRKGFGTARGLRVAHAAISRAGTNARLSVAFGTHQNPLCIGAKHCLVPMPGFVRGVVEAQERRAKARRFGSPPWRRLRSMHPDDPSNPANRQQIQSSFIQLTTTGRY